MTRIASTANIFKLSKRIRGSKGTDSYEDCDPDPHDPCDGWHFLKIRKFLKLKAMTVTRIVTPTPTIRVTANNQEERSVPLILFANGGGFAPRLFKAIHDCKT